MRFKMIRAVLVTLLRPSSPKLTLPSIRGFRVLCILLLITVPGIKILDIAKFMVIILRHYVPSDILSLASFSPSPYKTRFLSASYTLIVLTICIPNTSPPLRSESCAAGRTPPHATSLPVVISVAVPLQVQTPRVECGKRSTFSADVREDNLVGRC
jgi:hypothetical protein